MVAGDRRGLVAAVGEQGREHEGIAHVEGGTPVIGPVEDERDEEGQHGTKLQRPKGAFRPYIYTYFGGERLLSYRFSAWLAGSFRWRLVPCTRRCIAPWTVLGAADVAICGSMP